LQFGIAGQPTSWEAAPVIPGKWNRMEIFIDTDKGETWTRTNNKLTNHIKFDPNIALSGKLSPTLALLGFNGKTQNYQVSEFGEIYMDTSAQRVVIGDAPNWEDVKHSELQYPISWSSTKVEFKVNFGSLPASGAKYLYVFD